MNIYFQFLTQDQTFRAIEVLRLIPVLTDGAELKGVVKTSKQALISHLKFAGLETLLPKIQQNRLNQLEIIPDASKLRFRGVAARLISINGVFSPSPTSAIWLPTKDWRIEADRSSRNKYMTAKSQESALKFHHVASAPSVFEVVVTIATRSSRDAVLDGCASLLAKALPADLNILNVFGCCDVGGPEFTVELATNVLMTEHIRVMANVKPSAYPILGKRLEALHPVMFGSKRLCEGISKALGKGARVTTGTHASHFAVVRLGLNVDIEAATRRAANWLTHRADEPT